MRFADAAQRANTTPLLDGYSAVQFAKGQIQPFDDARRDSVNTLRRMLSVAPGTVMPVRRVVQIDTDRFLVGSGHADYFRGEPIRIKYPLHQAQDLCVLRTAAELCAGDDGRSFYGARSFIKNLAYEEQTSGLVPEFYIYSSPGEPVFPGFLQIGDEHFIVRATAIGETGLRESTCEQLAPDAVGEVTINTGTYNRVTEVWSASGATTTGVMVRWQAVFRYAHPEAPKNLAGTSVLLMDPDVAVGTQLTFNGRSYEVRGAMPMGGVNAYTVLDHGTP